MKKIIKIIVGALLAVCLTVLAKNSFSYRLPNENFGMQAVISRQKVEHLFIGSSLFRQGIDIFSAEEELGKDTYAVTYNGNQPVLMLKELEFMLRNGVEIENLYMDMYAYTAAADPWFSDTKILWDTDLKFKLELWQLMYLYGDAKAADFYEMFVQANNEYLLFYPLMYPLISHGFYKGGNARETEGAAKKELDNAPLLGTRAGIPQVQADAIEGIAALAKENDIRLVFLEIPKYYTMAEDKDYTGLREKITVLLESAGADYILAEELEFENSRPEYFQDLLHLSSDGRRVYTEELVQRLK